ncbi:MAG: hypothetical protein H0U75_08355 [Legionella sp.]|nr:hypothetical protein [Legionella sp.]
MLEKSYPLSASRYAHGTYYKQHLAPGIEDKVTAGSNSLSFPLNLCNAGVAICRDMDYPYPARSYGQANTNILFVPAWDFEVDATVHAAGAITRGIENGYTIVRTARSGYLSVTSPTGEPISEILTAKKMNNILTVKVPIWQNSSVYTKHQDWFIYILLFILLLLGGLYALRLYHLPRKA